MGVPHVVIVGGGFGGLSAAQALRRAPVRITLIDRQNHHLFQPLLYQVATAALNPSDIAAPIRSVLRAQRNVAVLLAEATAVDVPGKRLVLADGALPYDYLVLAPGVSHSYFGRDEWAPFAPGLKNLDDALEIRRRFLLAFEAAEREPEPARRRAWLTFVLVGAGPTGVEMAGALAEIARHTLVRDFRAINPAEARVLLVEGEARVLPAYPVDLSAAAERQLVGRGVEVRTGVRVTAVDADGVVVAGERIAARTVLWAAGVTASPLARSLGAPLDRAGRVRVTAALALPDHPEVFVIGDLAAVPREGGEGGEGGFVPGVAQGAIQGGRHAARTILRAVRAAAPTAFHYRDLGSLATIGRAAAVADFGRVHFAGLFAWLIWAFVHVMALVGFRNRFFVMAQWAWSFMTFSRGARLIVGPMPDALLAPLATPIALPSTAQLAPAPSPVPANAPPPAPPSLSGDN